MGCQAAKAAVLAMYTMNVRNVVDTTPKLPVVATAASVAQAKPRNAKEREKSIKIKPKGDGATCGWGWYAGLPLPSLPSPSPSGPLYVARTLEIPCRCAPHAETCVLIFWQKRTSTGEAKAQRTGEPRTHFTCSFLAPPLGHRKKNKQHCGAATGDCAGMAACGRMGGHEAGQGGEKDRERGLGLTGRRQRTKEHPSEQTVKKCRQKTAMATASGSSPKGNTVSNNNNNGSSKSSSSCVPFCGVSNEPRERAFPASPPTACLVGGCDPALTE